MTMTTAEAADTRIMAIVHNSLKRDLRRVRAALTGDPAPAGRQRRALGEHVEWLMDFLHDHHTAEDEGLWPLVRERNPEIGDLLDSLEGDHQRIAPTIGPLVVAAREYARTTGDEPRRALLTALDNLSEVLLPHLDREVDEAMPLVSASISKAEWEEWDQAKNIKPKSLPYLGIVGHWLLDDIDAEGRDVVVHQVPPIPRFVLLHGFAAAYRRQARRRWKPDPRAAAATGGA
jgi:hypothetical protein